MTEVALYQGCRAECAAWAPSLTNVEPYGKTWQQRTFWEMELLNAWWKRLLPQYNTRGAQELHLLPPSYTCAS